MQKEQFNMWQCLENIVGRELQSSSHALKEGAKTSNELDDLAHMP